VREFERAADQPSTISYLDNLEVLKSGGEELGDDTLLIDGQHVSVMSVHKAKGLEWDTVYIADLSEQSFPLKPTGRSLAVPEALMLISSADEHYAEERRLMYVAMTRARTNLIMSYSATHTGLTRRQPSRFLKEIYGEDLEAVGGIEPQAANLELFSPTEPKVKQAQLPSRLRSGDNLVLSASQAGDYFRCPQDFNYRHVLGVPQPPNPTTQVGTLLHEQLQRINQAKQTGSQWPGLDDILADIKANWPQEGYTSAHQRERALKQTLGHFKALYEQLKQEPVPAAVEHSFRVAIPGAKLLLTGRLDAVFEDKDGVEIRDYKSGTGADTAAKAKSKATNSSQLTLYALAWLLENGEIPARVTLDFIQTGQVASVKKQPKTLDSWQAKLAKTADDILAGRFPPGRDHRHCRHPVTD
jgi:DNA helicase-2/ATP-dependent DNA helicase PcrA